VTDKKEFKATDIVDYLDTQLARAVSTSRRLARLVGGEEEFDRVVSNFLITTGIKLASSGKRSKDEIQAVVNSTLESL
jgi:hypothetical protein